jgi:hypothetical protein
MWKSAICVFEFIILCAGPAAGAEYRGPKCLGPFCIGDYGPGTRMFRQLGGTSEELEMYCYQSRHGNVFLRVEMNDVGPKERIVEVVTLSDFSTCAHVPRRLIQITAADIGAWRTPEGIGLGSSEGDVIKAYGSPTRERRTDSNLYQLVVPSFRQGDPLPPVGSRMLTYEGKQDESRCAWFGIRDGRVAWISLVQ